MKTPVAQQSYELSPSQDLTMMNRQFAIKRSIVNIPTSIVIEEDLDLGLLEVALRLAVQRWDMFGLRVVKVGKQWRQYFGERDVICLRRVDFRGRRTSQMNKFFAREGSKTLPLENSPMAKLYIVITPEGHPGIFSVMNHLIADSWAISSFYKDVFDVYRALASGVAMPKLPQASEQVLIDELAYQNSKRFEADREYWRLELLEEPPIYTSILGSKVLE
ncbi:MAG: condensation domain-containing protein, partial [Brooklawnia sp.]